MMLFGLWITAVLAGSNTLRQGKMVAQENKRPPGWCAQHQCFQGPNHPMTYQESCNG